jgi:hypothetical protein
MPGTRNVLLVSFALVSISTAAAPKTPAPDPANCRIVPASTNDSVSVAPDIYKVLFENDDVRVLRIALPPQASDKPHTDPRSGVEFVERGPASPRSATHFDHEDQQHLTNSTEAPLQALRIELKHPGCFLGSSVHPVALDATDAVTAAPLSHKILYEDADIRVLDVTVPAHAREPMHTHAWPSIMVPLQMVPMRYFTPSETNPSTSNNPPVTELRAINLPPEGLHAVSNEGNTTGELVRFELKYASSSQR